MSSFQSNTPTIYVKKKQLSPTQNRNRDHKLSSSLLATPVVLGHHQRPDVENQKSVNTQLAAADDGEWVSLQISKLKYVSVEDKY